MKLLKYIGPLLILLMVSNPRFVKAAVVHSNTNINFKDTYLPFPPNQTEHLIAGIFSTRTEKERLTDDSQDALDNQVNVGLCLKDVHMTQQEYDYFKTKPLYIEIYNREHEWRAEKQFIFGNIFKNKGIVADPAGSSNVFASMTVSKSDGLPTEAAQATSNRDDVTELCDVRVEVEDKGERVTMYDTATDNQIVNRHNIALINISNPKRQLIGQGSINKLGYTDLNINQLKEIHFDQSASGFSEGYNALDMYSNNIYAKEDTMQYRFNQEAIFVEKLDKPYRSGAGYPIKVMIVSDEINRHNHFEVKLKTNTQLADSNLKFKSNTSNDQSLSLEKTDESPLNLDGKNYKVTTFEFPEVLAEQITGKLYLKKDISSTTNTQFPLINAGRKFYSQMWVKSVGESYPFSVEIIDRYGDVQVAQIAYDRLTEKLQLPVDSYLFASLDSETIEKDGLLLTPIDKQDPENSLNSKILTKSDLNWIKGKE